MAAADLKYKSEKPRKVIYARGFPYGAPLFMIRGGATRDLAIREFLKSERFTWDAQRYAWVHYLNRPECAAILAKLRDEYGCTIEAKSDLDTNYRIEGF